MSFSCIICDRNTPVVQRLERFAYNGLIMVQVHTGVPIKKEFKMYSEKDKKPRKRYVKELYWDYYNGPSIRYKLMKAIGKLAKIRKNRKAKGYKCRTTLKDLM